MGLQQVPCKRCNGCRIQKSKEWAIRCIHEAKTHGDNNSFITLTYNNDHLPKDASLKHEHFQKFIRALRQRTGLKLRYYMCGEYGKATEKNNYIARPHYHAILFGYAFPDRKNHTLRKIGRNYNQVYRSEILEKSWAGSDKKSRGFSEIGSVTWKSCAYVARYILKKQKAESSHYAIIDHSSGEITGYKKPEYTHMSLKPGVGYDYFMANQMDNYDYVMIEPGKKLEVPQYYKEKLKINHPALAERLKEIRVKRARLSTDNTPDRLKTRQYIQERQIQKLIREL